MHISRTTADAKSAKNDDKQCADNPKGGAAMDVRNSPIKNIYQIQRIGNRIMGLRLQTGKSIHNHSILKTYDPHMQYSQDDINHYWNDVSDTVGKIPKNLIKIRRADNNGSIAQSKLNGSIGKWAIKNTGRGNGENFENIMEEYSVQVPTLSSFHPKKINMN